MFFISAADTLKYFIVEADLLGLNQPKTMKWPILQRSIFFMKVSLPEDYFKGKE